MAFKKYGVENVTFKIIKECQRSELDNREVFYIESMNTLAYQHTKQCYKTKVVSVGEVNTSGVLIYCFTKRINLLKDKNYFIIA